jgi:hypothetical protein
LVLPFVKYKFQLQFFKSKWDNIFFVKEHCRIILHPFYLPQIFFTTFILLKPHHMHILI